MHRQNARPGTSSSESKPNSCSTKSKAEARQSQTDRGNCRRPTSEPLQAECRKARLYLPIALHQLPIALHQPLQWRQGCPGPRSAELESFRDLRIYRESSRLHYEARFGLTFAVVFALLGICCCYMYESLRCGGDCGGVRRALIYSSTFNQYMDNAHAHMIACTCAHMHARSNASIHKHTNTHTHMHACRSTHMHA